MPVAGMNLTGRIWRYTADTRDDDQGGAVPTGTILYDNIFSRIYTDRPTLVLLEQGLETPEIFNAYFTYPAPPQSYDVRQNDQYEVTWPPISPFYQKKFVIIGVQYPTFMDARHHLRVKLRRLVTANDNELQ
jgi:hypothetical protein